MIKEIFQSSQDPTKVSLTVTSGTQFIIFLVGYFAVSKGFDPMVAKTQVQEIIDIILSLVPASLAIYHGCQAVYGLVRKTFVANQ